ncbi:MAG: hypothetical protein ABI151_06510 [Chitinophagaceae bacterium]
MKLLTSLLAGLAGAIVLNVIHESVKRLDPEAPRVDLVGEEALTKTIEAVGGSAPEGNALYAATLAGDLVSNALYFSMIGGGKKKYLLLRGVGYGLAAGIGALKLTKPMGLNDAPVNRTKKTQIMTVAWYLIGGITTAATLKALQKKSC